MNNTDEIKPYFLICPDCKQPHAYRGLLFVECVNVFCKNYTEKQDRLVKEYFEKLAKEKADEVVNKDADYDENDFYSFGFVQLPQ